jgi:hypothetical protein
VAGPLEGAREVAAYPLGRRHGHEVGKVVEPRTRREPIEVAVDDCAPAARRQLRHERSVAAQRVRHLQSLERLGIRAHARHEHERERSQRSRRIFRERQEPLAVAERVL